MEFEAIDNQSVSIGGAGVVGAQIVSEHEAGVLISGNVRSNAVEVLNAAGILIYCGKSALIRENTSSKKGRVGKD